MNAPTLIAAALPAVFGLALAAQSVMARRKETLRRQLVESVLRFRASAPTLPATTTSMLQGGDDGALFRLSPAIAEHVRTALAATGDRLRLTHLVIAGGTVGVLEFVLALSCFGLSAPLAAIGALVGGGGIAFALLRHAQQRFQRQFLDGFPDALELIVRAVRAGLPLGDAIETVGSEIGGPVGYEFRHIHDRIAIGCELEAELDRTAERIRLVEFRFFVIALSLQRRTGGNLAETLNNLALTIRRRKEIGLKARALMSEARTSAWVIGLLPFIAGGALAFLNPDYMRTLIDDPRGSTILGAAALAMGLGAVVMRAMVKAALR